MLGSLDDSNVIARASHEADAVIDTAEANHAGVVEAIASALRGSGKPFLHTRARALQARPWVMLAAGRMQSGKPGEAPAFLIDRFPS